MMSEWIKKYALQFIDAIPLCKGMSRMQGKHFSGALKEVSVTVLLATFPLWAAAFYAALSNENNINDFPGAVSFFGDMLFGQINDGTLILYSASLIAPVLVMALEFKKDSQTLRVPSPMSYIVAVFMIQTAATIYFSKKVSLDYINGGFAFYASVSMFFLTVLVLFIVHCFKHFDMNLDPAGEIESSAANFRDAYSRHREVQS